MVWGMIAKGVLGMAGSVLPGAVGEFFKTKRDAQSLKHDYKKSVLHERAGSWKDEYIILVFTAQFPTFLVGFLFRSNYCLLFWCAVVSTGCRTIRFLTARTIGRGGL